LEESTQQETADTRGRGRSTIHHVNTNQVQEVAESLLSDPAIPVGLATKLAKQYYGRYAQRRGSMVVDVVSSAWRNYDRVEKQIVPAFEKSVRTPDLKSLAKVIPDCEDGYDPCTMTVSYDAMATLKEGTNVYLWIATNRPNQPGDDGSWSTWDSTILGSTLKVSGSMNLQQVRP
jgi:hypothetical protein